MITSFFICRFLLPGATNNNSELPHSHLKNIFIYALLHIILIVIIVIRISAYHESDLELLEGPVKGTVTKVTDKRYNKEILIEPDKNLIANVIIAAYCPKNYNISVNDIIQFNNKLNRITCDDNMFRSYSLSQIRKGIIYRTYIDSSTCNILKQNTTAKTAFRTALKKNIDKLFNKNTASVIKALFLGNKNYIQKEILYNYKKAGVLHVLAASGLHVCIIVLLPISILGLFRIKKKYTLVVALFILYGYLFITDMPVSLQRATIMFTIFTIQTVFGIEKNIFNTLFLSGIIILLIHPYELYNLGFQLSFGATLGIILFHKKFTSSLIFMPSKLKSLIAITLAAQILVIPIIASQLEELNIAGIFTNVIVVPLISIILVLAIITQTVYLFSDSCAQFIGHITDIVFEISNFFVTLASTFNLHFNVSITDFKFLIPFFILIVPLLPKVKKKSVKMFAIILSVALFIFWFLPRETDYLQIFEYKGGFVLFMNNDIEDSLIGDIPDIDTAQKILKHMRKINITNLKIIIPNPSYSNIKSYSYLIKKLPVKSCFLSNRIYFTNYMKYFFSILDEDNTTLELFNGKNYKNLTSYNKKVIDQNSQEDIMNFYYTLKSNRSIMKHVDNLPEIAVIKLQ